MSEARPGHRRPGQAIGGQARPIGGPKQGLPPSSGPCESDRPYFGEIIEGLDILENIGETPTAAMDRPKTEVKMKKVYINF